LLDHRFYGEHHFLAQEFVEGANLFAATVKSLPLLTRLAALRDSTAPATHTAWALDVLDRIEQALTALAGRGLRLGELDPRSVILRPDGRPVLTDLASAAPPDDSRAPAAADPEFSVPAGLSAADAHSYLLSRLSLWLFLPLPCPVPEKQSTLAAAVTRHYPVPSGFENVLLRGLRSAGRPVAPDTAAELFTRRPAPWPALRDSLAGAVMATATPERPDRLFPSTPTTRTSIGGYSFAYGAAGVLYALHHAGVDIPAAYTDWLGRAVRADRNPRPGLYDGLHGVALVLDALGRRDEALDVLDRSAPLDDHVTTLDLDSGSAGIALNLLHFGRITGDGTWTDRALRIGAALAAKSGDGPPPARRHAPAPYGLLHGPTGHALLFQHLHEATGQARYLDLAATALQHDLDRCEFFPDGTVKLFDGTRHLAYLHGGSGGLAYVLRNQLRHREDSRHEKTLHGILQTCGPVYVQNSGLLRGRAGKITVLAELGRPEDREDMHTQVQFLGWYARPYRGHIAFPGFRMLRLSMDLATGTAGVLLALTAAFGEGPRTVLPHLDPAVDRKPH
jgi:hypothetical protein